MRNISFAECLQDIRSIGRKHFTVYPVSENLEYQARKRDLMNGGLPLPFPFIFRDVGSDERGKWCGLLAWAYG